jgi:DNA-binding transcriptional MocR family regulator
LDSVDIDPIIHQLGNWNAARGPLHSRLEVALQSAIRHGVLAPGTRLPAERNLAQALALSRTTVLTAYSTLKSDGWLESRPGSGTWVCARPAAEARQRTHDSTIAGSSTLNLLQIDSELIDFAVGTTKPLAELPRELFSASPALQDSLLAERHYMPLGYPALRQAIAAHYSNRGLPTTASQILVTGGAQQAISLVTSAYVQRGDTVLVESPTYFGALDVFRFAGARLAPVVVGPEHVRSNELRDRLLATGPRLVYLTPTYQNPTGVVMPESARREVAQLADEFGVPVMEDHSLSELTIDGGAPQLIARHGGDKANIISLGSLSKLLWAGLRVGWLRAPVTAIAKIARVKTAADLGSPLLTQAIAVQLLQAVEEAKAVRRAQLRERRDLLAALLREALPSWQFQIPSGGLFLWVRLAGYDTRQFAQLAARNGVALTPGPLFAADDSCMEYLRIPYLLDEDQTRIGVQRLAESWREFLSSASFRSQRATPLV